MHFRSSLYDAGMVFSPPRPAHASDCAPLRRLWVWLCSLSLCLCLLGWSGLARATDGEGELTLTSRYWIDTAGDQTVDEVASQPTGTLVAMDQFRSFQLGSSALWMRLDLPPLDTSQRWYLLLSAAAFTNQVSLYSKGPDGTWTEQRAGDHLPVAQWDHPDQTPVFAIDAQAQGPVWLRVLNSPTPTSPRVQLLTENSLQIKRYWTFLMVGGYLGFGLLVLFLGWVHARLYGDRAFVAYCFYVAFMLGFQAAFTGIGGLFFWDHSPRWNDMAPAVFMLWLTASGIWFVREVCAVSRHHRGVDRFVVAWSVFGLVYPLVYVTLQTPLAFAVLNLYGLLSVLLSVALCLWTWRLGEAYSGWLALGFLPVHLGYPFPALRSAGVLPDGWAMQYAVLIGSAIEIPLLLYILHRRAKDFSENRARLRALESTDPLTGLTIPLVLTLRLRDALRRSRRYGHQCGMVLVELANHAEIVDREGREAGDRALVVAASRLSAVVRDVDTVCRIADTRFAMLIEGPQRPDQLKLLAQHVVARGLERVPTLPVELTLRFRLVSATLPDAGDASDAANDDERLMERLHRALDRLAGEPRKVVLHLPVRMPAGV
jgi:two-component system, sensor histidine kinase LadS